jgi:hypothetical protein
LYNYDALMEILENNNVELLKQKIERIEDPKFLHELSINYNWDNGFLIPSLIVENENCDLGTALLLFYHSDGFALLGSDYCHDLEGRNEWYKFIIELYSKIEMNDFKHRNISYEPNITRVQKFKLQKKNPDLSSIFLEGLRS